MFMRDAVLKGLILAMATAGLVWGGSILPISEAADDFGYFEYQLLQSETFDPGALAQELASPAAQVVSDCDTHSETALLLIEMRLTQAALRAGRVQEFDKLAETLDSRSKRVLGCTPHLSFVWLLRFSLEAMHGRLNEQAFNLLTMSYETSPNEAWISIRRIVVALPFVLVASEPLRKRILFEFSELIRNDFFDVTVRSYLSSSEPIRLLLQTQIERLPLARQKAFSDAMRRLGS